MWTGNIEELLNNNNKDELVLKPFKNKYIAYFSDKPNMKAIGNTELEALDNLKLLIDNLIKRG